MARDLAPVLGASKGGEGYFSYLGGYISWARGHMLEMVGPSSYDPSWKSWSWESLPMIPADFNFQHEPRGDCKPQLLVLKKLYKDVDIVVNACDAGREGELIWWEILRYCGWGKGNPPPHLGDKLALRLWAQSNTSSGLREAWETMFPVSDRLGLAEGAYSRAEADWLLGLNLTRAATLSFAPPVSTQERKGFWSIGRVQTPILSLICERDNTIENFVPKTFWQVKAIYEGKDSTPFEATLLVPSGMPVFKDEVGSPEPSGDETGLASGASNSVKESKAFATAKDANIVLERILNSRPQLWDVTQTTKKSVENPPNLFSLTSLQKWCNKSWGWEAKRTLDAAQAAYESDKSLTYPRTDACFLPKDSVSKMDSVFDTLVAEYLKPLRYDTALCPLKPSQSPRAGYLFDDSKLTDHYAIVPTGVIPKDLTSDSGQVWLAVVRRFMTSFSRPAQVSTLTRRLSLGEDVAITSGKSYDDLGWIDLDNNLSRLTGHEPKVVADLLPPCPDQVPLKDAKIHEGKTTPPKPFTEATLLSLMENIHTKFEDSEDGLKEALGSKGIGTPATRAAIIELLIARAYILRQKKGSTTFLRATDNGKTLISNLRDQRLELLTQAQLTAEWESKLLEMEKGVRGGINRVAFLEGICKVVRECIGVLSTNRSPMAPRSSRGAVEAQDLDISCPFTGKPIKDHGGYWVVPHYPNSRLYKTIAGRDMRLPEYLDVLRNHSPVFSGFTSTKGKKFTAKLRYDASTGKFQFEFDQTTGVEGEATKHFCPNTGKPIVDNGKFWAFPECPTRFWKEVSGRKMKVTDYIELVKTGRTAFFENFKSKAGKPFTAALVLDKTLNQVKFEFPSSGANGSGPVSSASLVKNMGMKGPGVKAKRS